MSLCGAGPGGAAEGTDLQDMMGRLGRFWAGQGCVLLLPYDVEKGAGTMNPATFFRALGPEPWRAAYVEPSRRPNDGRYGENPNRVFQHFQYQVVLKPSPPEVQRLYLDSLEAVGIKLRDHDVRFVEDNWETPALNAWGVGWEVWLDGMEVTQFTYFQQVGGFEARPVMVEMTYGLERLAMLLQGRDNYFQVDWGGGISYGEIWRQNEYEQSCYSFEAADPARLARLFEEYENEARRALEAGLILPAYEQVLKCSHTFNLLESRGAISVTQRTALLGRVRALARRCAAAYLERREKAGFPLLGAGGTPAGRAAAREATAPAAPVAPAAPTTPAARETAAPGPGDGGPRDLLFEVGCEELPARWAPQALEQLTRLAAELFDRELLDHGPLAALGTPRRLALLASGVAARQRDREVRVKGPPARAAFDAQGRPTVAAQGFARGQGVRVEDLVVERAAEQGKGGGEYVFARRVDSGCPAPEVLARILPEIVDRLECPRTMRWGQGGHRFARPLRWIVALWGRDVVPLEVMGLQSGRTTQGLRFPPPPAGGTGGGAAPDRPQAAMELDHAGQYRERLAGAGVVVDPAERRRLILEGVQEAAARLGGRPLLLPDLLEEVTFLVERPQALCGSFDPEFLSLPPEVLVTAMRAHQRYFPVVAAGPDGQPRDGAPPDGARLVAGFCAVANGGLDPGLIRAGHEKVLRARLADGRFFFKEDQRRRLEERVDELDRVLFQERLGTLLDRTRRLERLAERLALRLTGDAALARVARRAAHLCKADLVTAMVGEFPELQGVMGGVYAGLDGEEEAVARAIGEHYRPRFAGDEPPVTAAGAVVGLADRLDALVGCFLVDIQPTGSEDPYGLRRQGAGLVAILRRLGLEAPLGALVEEALAGYGREVAGRADPQKTLAAVLDFLGGRLRTMLEEDGFGHDVIEAVLATGSDCVPRVGERARALARLLQSPQLLDAVVTVFRRTAPLSNTRPQGLGRTFEAELAPAAAAPPGVDAALLCDASELELFEAARGARGKALRALAAGDYWAVLEAVSSLRPVVDRFFDAVLVMVEDEAVRANRLQLLHSVARLILEVGDPGRLAVARDAAVAGRSLE